MSRKSLRKRIQGGESLLGTFLRINSPELVEIMGFAGFDFVIIDLEHGTFGIESVAHLVRAAEASSTSALVRVPENRENDIFKALDTGARGIIVPRTTTREEAGRAVAAARFSPMGIRGACPRVRAAHYTAIPASQYYSSANEENAVIILVESPEGVARLPEMLETPGVDAVMLGATDLSHALGVPGQYEHPTVQARIEEVIKQAEIHQVAVGMVARDMEEARSLLGRGVRLMVFSGDETIFYQACRSVREELKIHL